MLNKYGQEIDTVQLESIKRSIKYLQPKDDLREVLDWLGFVVTIALMAWLFLWVLKG